MLKASRVFQGGEKVKQQNLVFTRKQNKNKQKNPITLKPKFCVQKEFYIAYNSSHTYIVQIHIQKRPFFSALYFCSCMLQTLWWLPQLLKLCEWHKDITAAVISINYVHHPTYGMTELTLTEQSTHVHRWNFSLPTYHGTSQKCLMLPQILLHSANPLEWVPSGFISLSSLATEGV